MVINREILNPQYLDILAIKNMRKSSNNYRRYLVAFVIIIGIAALKLAIKVANN